MKYNYCELFFEMTASQCMASDIKENWESRIHICELIIKAWMGRHLSIYGGITLMNTFLMSQFLYIMQGIILPNHVLSRLNTFFFKFIWNNQSAFRENDLKRTPEKIKRSTMKQSSKHGGLNMIDMFDVQRSMAFKWVALLSIKGNGAWRILPIRYLNKHGKDLFLFNMNIDYQHFRGIEGYFPPFYKILLTNWLNVDNRNSGQTVENSTQSIWNNRLVKYRGNVIFFKRWIQKDILCLFDIITNGIIIEYEYISAIVGDTSLTLFEYNAVANAIKCSNIKQVYSERDLTIYFNNIPIDKQSSKAIRGIFVQSQLGDNVSIPKYWRDRDMTISEDTWQLPFIITKEIKLIMLQWKILHCIYPTRSVLFKMNIVDTRNCIVCDVEDNLECFFYFV